jgi:diaminopimelate decarboxylase
VSGFERIGATLHVDGVALEAVAERFGTPTYVYSAALVRERYRAFDAAFAGRPHRICYAVKANSNLALLRLLADLGAGFDIVSGGELERVLRAGGRPERVVFSGVGKTRQEIERALDVGIGCFNVESEMELGRIETLARARGLRAPVSVRVNPDVDAETHPYISTGLKENKFGVSSAAVPGLYRRIENSDALRAVGIDFHIGSQLTRVEPFLDAIDRVLELVDGLAADGITLEHLDLGGGLGVRYDDETPPDLEAYARGVTERTAGRGLELLFEPGRWLVGDAGALLVRVEYAKENEGRRFLVVDGAMNDLLRPALYQAWHDIEVVTERGTETQIVDVVGPVCESADFLGKGRALGAGPGDLLAVRSAGAYGFGMSSNYNTRGRAAEVLVDGGAAQLVRRRETIEDQLACELEALEALAS